MLIIRALFQYYAYYGNDFTIECPTGSGHKMNLYQVAEEISRRLGSIFLKGKDGHRPVNGGEKKLQEDPLWRDYIQFYEYFHGDNGAGHRTEGTPQISVRPEDDAPANGRWREEHRCSFPPAKQVEASFIGTPDAAVLNSGSKDSSAVSNTESHPSILKIMKSPLYPSLYQINARVWLTQLSRQLGRRATLDDIPDGELDCLAAMGFDWIWLLSVWQTGAAAQAVSRSNPEWRREFEHTLPDLTDDDIPGSGFAITGYKVHESLGGDAALARVRERLRQRGLRLMLDFVPNHMAPDHPWIAKHPEYFVGGSEADLANAPQNYFKPQLAGGSRVFAYGRDPYFSGWPDTIQLNYGNPALQEAMIGELTRIAGQCDGLRCDMAMLILPDVFERTWGIKAPLFWPEATRRVREKVPGFCFMAEVYWGREWDIQQQGFDYAYDKTLYDRLREGHARPVREHLFAGLDYQNKLARFLENHDEPRAAATFPDGQHQAAAVITFLSPGLRFFHQGQFECRLKRISPHLCRAPEEKVNEPLRQFYNRLLETLRRPVLRQGQWKLLECVPGWDGNGSFDGFIAFGWQEPGEATVLVTVNYSGHPGQCYVRLPFSELGGRHWSLRDLLSEAHYERDGNDIQSKGLYLDVPPWQHHAFELKPL